MSAPLLALLLVAGANPRTPEPLGQFGRWGAFRDGGHCYAIAAPPAGHGASLAISTWPAGGIRAQLHVRLAHTGDGPVTLVAGGRRFALMVRGAEAWAMDARADLAILAAMRRGGALAVARGTRARDRDLYPLEGAPSAIDAALAACQR